MSPLHPLYWWELFKRHPFAVAGGFLTVFLATSNWFIYLDRLEVEDQLDKESKAGQEVLENVANSPLVRQQAAAIRHALSYLNASLITETNLPDNVGYFYGLEEKARVKIEVLQQLSSPTPPESAPYRAVPFTFRATSGLAELAGLVHMIETGPHASKFSRFSFVRREDNPALIEASFTVHLLAHP